MISDSNNISIKTIKTCVIAFKEVEIEKFDEKECSICLNDKNKN